MSAMSESVFLSAADVERITKKKRWAAQCRVLKEKGYKFTRAGAKNDGEPLVRADGLDADGKPKQSLGHRWDRIGNVRQIRP